MVTDASLFKSEKHFGGGFSATLPVLSFSIGDIFCVNLAAFC
jgi:hypothetical protein